MKVLLELQGLSLGRNGLQAGGEEAGGAGNRNVKHPFIKRCLQEP